MAKKKPRWGILPGPTTNRWTVRWDVITSTPRRTNQWMRAIARKLRIPSSMGRATAMPASGHQLATRRTLHSVRCPADTHPRTRSTMDGQTADIQWRAAPPPGPLISERPKGRRTDGKRRLSPARVHYRAAIHASHATERQVRRWYTERAVQETSTYAHEGGSPGHWYAGRAVQDTGMDTSRRLIRWLGCRWALLGSVSQM